MRNSCIVLGDKHQNILEGLRGLLTTLFGGVVMVADLPSLFKALDRIKPNLAIVDLSLLGDEGINNASEITKRFPDIPLIILSNYDEPEIVEDVISTGALGFVLKQYAGTDLFDAISNVRKGQIYISPAVKNKLDER
jgi:DNA-binding NarL/FixJ family response regulator